MTALLDIGASVRCFGAGDENFLNGCKHYINYKISLELIHAVKAVQVYNHRIVY